MTEIDDEMRDCPHCGSRSIWVVVLAQCGECGLSADGITAASLCDPAVEMRARAKWNDLALREGLPERTRKFERPSAIDDTGIAQALRILSEDDDDQAT